MYFLYNFWHALWIARVVLQAILLVVLIRREIYRQFPIFLVYTAWQVVISSLLVLLDYVNFSSAGYYYYELYRINTAGWAILGFCILYELFDQLISDYPVLRSTGRSLYRQTVLFFLAIALALAWYAPAYSAEAPIPNFSVLQRSVRLLQCGLLIFLFAFARSFGLSWKNRVFGIALGFGIAATVSLVLAAIRVHMTVVVGPTIPKTIMELVNQTGDLSALGVWLAYVLAPESKRIDVFPTFPDENLQSWNRELRRLLP
jgi:hypothetical protein